MPTSKGEKEESKNSLTYDAPFSPPQTARNSAAQVFNLAAKINIALHQKKKT